MKKRSTTTKRRSSIARRTSTSPQRRKVTRRKKGFLSEMLPKAAAIGGAKASAAGLAGGGLAVMLDKLLFNFGSDGQHTKRFFTLGGATILTAMLFRQPNVAAGMAGYVGSEVLKNLLFKNEGISEFADPIMALPPVLNAQGELSESEAYLSNGSEAFLQEAYDARYIPNN